MNSRLIYQLLITLPCSQCTNSIGVKTLDPREEEYVPYYDNEDESHYKTAHGFSYHNGPEWVWVYGMFLKAGISAFSNELSL